MSSCSMCGSSIPGGQGVCSMCYDDIAYGRDGYYEEELKRDQEEWDRQEEGEE